MDSLRERKKQATRVALQEAALRLALRKGPENVRVEEIAEAVGVSPRTYNNYFPSREHAIVAALTAARAPDIPAGVPLADGIIDAVVRFYTDPGEAMLIITTNPALRTCYADAVTGIEEPVAAAIAARGADPRTAEVLAAAVAAAARVALRRWLQPTGVPGLMMVSGTLPELIRAALAPLSPALDAVKTHPVA
ncbi:TetR/AcrR family transcriptional regulator [Paractinoplanes toevensis]|uniref:TetR family transcriptional regulator n=1 Tax=Paractinoplanes toevensis TaxID=571911 RepID=A0A919TAH9_9ACTN|nr:TetR/AcrR family transcriptional regulator [Actinoplanes toevensis]GIM90551.1 TetR family transcriptional regulator [Actinoplanes toevensis]